MVPIPFWIQVRGLTFEDSAVLTVAVRLTGYSSSCTRSMTLSATQRPVARPSLLSIG